MSATSAGREVRPLSHFHEWWADRHRNGNFEVTRVPFEQLDDWHFESGTGNLRHTSGRYFTVAGLRVRDGSAGTPWEQPVLNQPEIGILGILAKYFNGVLHFLMQAKMEPGNVNSLQLSPTVQATRSNYSRVHRGAHTRYLEYFREPRQGRVLVDVLQSEQGAWFLGKRNRNMVVRTDGDVPEHEDFHWLTLRQLRALLGVDHLVSMDARTVLASLPLAPPRASLARTGAAPGTSGTTAHPRPFTDALLRSYEPEHEGGGALHTRYELLSWFTERKTALDWSVDLIPLADVRNWRRDADEIADDERREFRIMAARVLAENREVSKWSQPLLAPRGEAAAVFLTRTIRGVLHVLVQAMPQPGLRDLVELGPTVYVPPGGDPAAAAAGLPFGGAATGTDPERVRFDTTLSEEGGRFFHARTRYRVVEAGPDFPVEVPATHCWMTVRQLNDLVQHGHYLNIEARSLLACVHSLW
ncbi:NDP-hexose 2,3-dehydratase family protein [Streptomyces armeniacus]|uniref:NDP-hexose 2,3-dehydratase family protein n=1 Tax=Streptomyces armeniacus TaxID=83291 RepID=UPI001FE5289B|nr:NDP-hexose 2,3-dehydratase family protein [Streptomyces armeniacus]